MNQSIFPPTHRSALGAIKCLFTVQTLRSTDPPYGRLRIQYLHNNRERYRSNPHIVPLSNNRHLSGTSERTWQCSRTRMRATETCSSVHLNSIDRYRWNSSLVCLMGTIRGHQQSNSKSIHPKKNKKQPRSVYSKVFIVALSHFRPTSRHRERMFWTFARFHFFFFSAFLTQNVEGDWNHVCLRYALRAVVAQKPADLIFSL